MCLRYLLSACCLVNNSNWSSYWFLMSNYTYFPIQDTLNNISDAKVNYRRIKKYLGSGKDGSFDKAELNSHTCLVLYTHKSYKFLNIQKWIIKCKMSSSVWHSWNNTQQSGNWLKNRETNRLQSPVVCS